MLFKTCLALLSRSKSGILVAFTFKAIEAILRQIAQYKMDKKTLSQAVDGPPIIATSLQAETKQIQVQMLESKEGNHVNSDQQDEYNEKQWLDLVKLAVINSHTDKFKEEFQLEGREDIEEINFAWLKLGWKLAYYLAKVKLPNLKKLSLTDNKICAEGAAYLGKSEWPNLEVIDLRNNNIGSLGMKNLSSADWPNLQYLLLNCNNITRNGFSSIRMANWTNIRELNLSGNKLGTQGINSLSKMDMVFLKTLDLGNCKLGVEAVRRMINANWPDLILLNLTINNIKDEGVRLLAKSNWPKLQYLQIQFNNIRSGLRLLSGKWPEMKFPYLYGNRATVEMIEETVIKLIAKDQSSQ